MWRVKTDAKFKNSFFPVLIYWSDSRIHLGTIKNLLLSCKSPPTTIQAFVHFAKLTSLCKFKFKGRLTLWQIELQKVIFKTDYIIAWFQFLQNVRAKTLFTRLSKITQKHIEL